MIGFCLGGGLALLYAAPAPGAVRAVSVNYGYVPVRRSRLRDICPVVASYGGRDLITRTDPARLQSSLDALGVPGDIKVYPASGHAFMSPGSESRLVSRMMVPMRIGYQRADAEDSWRRILAFFDTHVRQGVS